MRVLVTGATGFVGRGVMARLAADSGIVVRAAVRRHIPERVPGIEQVVVGEVSCTTDWSAAASGVDVVIHLAARVHVMRETADDPLTEFRRVNVAGTMNLAWQAAAARVTRIVYLSSIKVNGNVGRFTEADPPAPTDAYGISKAEAEAGLRQVAAETGMAAVIIRPPLVYGPGVKGNIRSLMRAIVLGVPLPLGAINNRRSLVGLDNLADFIAKCAWQAPAANQTFLVSDGGTVSTTELIRGLAMALGRPARLIPVPSSFLNMAASAIGRRDVAERILGSLEVDINKARTELSWSPPFSFGEQLRRTASAFKAEASS